MNQVESLEIPPSSRIGDVGKNATITDDGDLLTIEAPRRDTLLFVGAEELLRLGTRVGSRQLFVQLCDLIFLCSEMRIQVLRQRLIGGLEHGGKALGPRLCGVVSPIGLTGTSTVVAVKKSRSYTSHRCQHNPLRHEANGGNLSTD